MKGNFEGRHGPMLIAEIGGNHEGDFEYAKRLVQLAIESDVDVIKFQIYTGDSLVSNLESPERNLHFKKFELTQDQHLHLADMVLKAGMKYTSSVWDVKALKWIDDKIELYKIGSGDLTAYPILKTLAKIGKPMILSTGLSTEDEILDAVRYIQDVNPIYKKSDQLAILQCTSMYPIGPEDANLNVMTRLKEITRLSVGYSDHTEGSEALKYAVAMGAELLEFHFTDSRECKTFRDHKVSLIKDEILNLIREIRLIRTYQGDSEKKPVPIEIETDHISSFRRGVYPSKDIVKGERLSEENLTVLRPNHGIDARQYFEVVGKIAKTDLKKGQKLDWELFE